MNKKWYKIYLMENDKKVLLATVNSKGLAIETKKLYEDIYKIKDNVKIVMY